MWVHHLMLEKHCFCKYRYTSFPQISVQRRAQLCPQWWVWRGISAGYSGRVLLWDSPLHQTISVPTSSKKQRTVPLFSCLCNVKEKTDKEEEGCLKTLENAKIRRKKRWWDCFTLLWWKAMKSDCSDSWGRRPPWPDVIRTGLAELQLAGHQTARLKAGAKSCIRAQFYGTSQLGESIGGPVSSLKLYVFMMLSSNGFVLYVRAAQSSCTATSGCPPAAWYLHSVAVSEFSNSSA